MAWNERAVATYADVEREGRATGIALMFGCLLVGTGAVAAGGLDGDWVPSAGAIGGLVGAPVGLLMVRSSVRQAPLGMVGAVRDSRRAAAVSLAVLLAAGGIGILVHPSATLSVVLVLAVGLPLVLGWDGGWYRWFERETGTRVYRETGVRWNQRYVRVPLKDPAPAQRISRHAQSEAPRRAP